MPIDENGEELDPQIIAIAQAIRQRETGGGPAVEGQTGEIKSRFQFLQGTWDTLSKRHLGDRAGEQPTDATENEVVYKEVKRLAEGPYSAKEKKQLKAMKQERFDVGNIGSIWNRGLPQFHLYSEKFDKVTGTNPNYGKGVSEDSGYEYDTGDYVDSVYVFYKRNMAKLKKDESPADALQAGLEEEE